jgi:hypothetical protein
VHRCPNGDFDYVWLLYDRESTRRFTYPASCDEAGFTFTSICNYNVITMLVKIVQIGNSHGVRIAKPLLEASGLGDEVDLRVYPGRIELVSANEIVTNDSSAVLDSKGPQSPKSKKRVANRVKTS